MSSSAILYGTCIGTCFLIVIIIGILIPTIFLQSSNIYVSTTLIIPTPYPTIQPTSLSPTTLQPSLFPPSLAPTIFFPYSIEISYQHAYTLIVTSSVDQAVNDWRSIISAPLPGTVIVNESENICGYVFSETTIIDDLLIHISIQFIDGLGGVLGYAGPCLIDSNSYPRFGIIVLDEDDVIDLIENDLFNIVIKHEIGHVLGIGTLWTNGTTFDENTIQTPSGGYPYLLPFANEEDTLLGRIGGASVEDTGGSGTAKGHWKELVYDHELMTGYVESSGSMPLSRLTIGALRDLGYNVTFETAESYTLPTRRRRLRNNQKRYYKHCVDQLPPPKRVQEILD